VSHWTRFSFCYLRLFWAGVFVLAGVNSSLGNTSNTEDIDQAVSAVREVWAKYEQQSFEDRYVYEYAYELGPNRRRENFCDNSKRTANELVSLGEQLKKFREFIEQYEGGDWDAKYEATGLWKKVVEGHYEAFLRSIEVSYWAAVATGDNGGKRTKEFRHTLDQIDSANEDFLTGPVRLLRARILWGLGETNMAAKEIQAVRIQTAFDETVRCQAEIEQMRLFGPSKDGQAAELVRTAERIDADNSVMLNAVFACARYDGTVFENVIKSRPELKQILGRIILLGLDRQLNSLGKRSDETDWRLNSGRQLTVFEAELAVMAALKDEENDWKNVLSMLAEDERLGKSATINYAAGVKLLDNMIDSEWIVSADNEVLKAIGLLVRACELLVNGIDNSGLCPADAREISTLAMYAGYQAINNLDHFEISETSQKRICKTAIVAFDNYEKIVGVNNWKMQFWYVDVLDKCGNRSKAEENLNRIATKSDGHWSLRARIELISRRLEKPKLDNKQQEKVSAELREIIRLCDDNAGENYKQLRAQTVGFFCEYFSRYGNANTFHEIIALLSDPQGKKITRRDIYLSRAKMGLGQVHSAAEYLGMALQNGQGIDSADIARVLSTTAETADELLEQPENFEKTINICLQLGAYATESGDKESQDQEIINLINISIAELVLYSADEQHEKLYKAKQWLKQTDNQGSIEHKRVTARILMIREEFETAAVEWAKIADMLNISDNIVHQAKKSKWRQAKYYELYCYAHTGNNRASQVIHTIEVMQAEEKIIDGFWSKKLVKLKKKLVGAHPEEK